LYPPFFTRPMQDKAPPKIFSILKHLLPGRKYILEINCNLIKI